MRHTTTGGWRQCFTRGSRFTAHLKVWSSNSLIFGEIPSSDGRLLEHLLQAWHLRFSLLLRGEIGRGGLRTRLFSKARLEMEVPGPGTRPGAAWSPHVNDTTEGSYMGQSGDEGTLSCPNHQHRHTISGDITLPRTPNSRHRLKHINLPAGYGAVTRSSWHRLGHVYLPTPQLEWHGSMCRGRRGLSSAVTMGTTCAA